MPPDSFGIIGEERFDALACSFLTDAGDFVVVAGDCLLVFFALADFKLRSFDVKVGVGDGVLFDDDDVLLTGFMMMGTVLFN